MTLIEQIAADVAEVKANQYLTRTVLRPKEAADYIGVAESTIYKMTSANIIPFSKPNGKMIFFSREKLDEWLLSNPSKSANELNNEASTYLATRRTAN